jgi:hypothetical protein
MDSFGGYPGGKFEILSNYYTIGNFLGTGFIFSIENSKRLYCITGRRDVLSA